MYRSAKNRRLFIDSAGPQAAAASLPILILTLLLLSPRIRAVFILVVVAWAVIFSIGSNQEEGEEGDGDNHGGVEEEVEQELVEQQAMERQETVEALMFLAIQGAATTIAILRNSNKAREVVE